MIDILLAVAIVCIVLCINIMTDRKADKMMKEERDNWSLLFSKLDNLSRSLDKVAYAQGGEYLVVRQWYDTGHCTSTLVSADSREDAINKVNHPHDQPKAVWEYNYKNSSLVNVVKISNEYGL